MSTTPPSLHTYPLKPTAWNERDLLLFASSIGCTETQLHYLYELDPNFQAFPTYPIVLTFKHDYTNVSKFAEHFRENLTPPKGCIKGFPELENQKVVDGERNLEIITSLPRSSAGRKFFIRSAVTGIWDKGQGKPTIVKTTHDVIEHVSSSRGPLTILYTRMDETAIFMSQGGWGGPNPASPSPKQQHSSIQRKPDAMFRYAIPATAHLLYRLNGDYNPLHAREVKEAVVQPTPIMHGLFSWNVVARGIIEKFGGEGRGQGLKKFGAKFARPVRPEDVLETEMWVEEEEGKGSRVVRFETRVGGEVVLGAGVARIEVDGRGRAVGSRL